VIAAAVLYVPANYYPVLTVMQLGAGAPSTIIGGVRELIASGLYPLAALVFFAGIAVPMLKLVELSAMLTATAMRRSFRLRDRTRLSFLVRWIGRWSMIDIFMESCSARWCASALSLPSSREPARWPSAPSSSSPCSPQKPSTRA
jgi:paraquat-inducible protein A